MSRLERDPFFMGVAFAFAARSTCLRGNVGAVIVRDKYIISGGYNGSPPGMPHCLDVGCLEGPDGGCTRTIHAEANAVIHAARLGIPCDDAVMYATHSMCAQCAAIVASAGIRKVYYRTPYRLTAGLELLNQMNIEVIQLG